MSLEVIFGLDEKVSEVEEPEPSDYVEDENGTNLNGNVEPDLGPSDMIEVVLEKKPDTYRQQMVQRVFDLYSWLQQHDVFKSDYSRSYFEIMSKRELIRTLLRYLITQKKYKKSHGYA